MEHREHRHMRPAQPVPRRLPVRHDPAVIADLHSDALARQRPRPPAPKPKVEILPPGSGLPIRFAPHMFKRCSDRLVEVPHGLSLAEIVEHLVGEPVPPELVDVYLDGEVIPPTWWPRLRPKPAAKVKVVLIPAGGADTLRLALTAAVVVAAAAVVVATGGTALAAYGPLIGAGIPLARPLAIGAELP